MKSIFVILFFSALISQAHVEPGPHKGKTTDGQACEMLAGKTFFDKNMPHPLNERVELTVNGELFIVQHPPVISVENMTAFFDHDHFQGVLATKTGAKALVVKMEHSDSFEGPSEFHLITHEYKNNVRSVINCKLN